MANSITKVIGKKIKWKVLAHMSILMGQSIQDNGKITSIMEKDNMNLQMEPSTKVNGKIIACMDQDFTLIIWEENGKANIGMVNSKVETKNNC
jgi:hypothetical protein